jgi:SAM-dependent methyltransferase
VLHQKLPQFGSEAKILDLGFGDGTLLQEFARLRPGHAFWGVDPSPLELNALRASLSSDEFWVCTKLEDLDPALKFDLIIASHVYYYFDLSDWPHIHDSLVERLAPGGLLAVAMASRDSEIYFTKSDFASCSQKVGSSDRNSSRFLHIENLMHIRPRYVMSWSINYGLDVDEDTFRSFYVFVNRLDDLSSAQARHCARLYADSQNLITDKWLVYKV